ncbi:MAG: bifunctional (p)ppGpp synthetase/guanosine-3',5'-bis(diphosphate) 3'-pyrophosphohydrolase [Gammaproteobacteria bacterium]|nr:bifunctional (p)ppGpp synthetase/guanosine-3',5'-bis(diphosphate) 3'-pyrophosphohydrolase [Gammaproteobacteria bacterium]
MPTPNSTAGLIEKASKYLSPEQVARIQIALEFGALAHQGQTRKSGEDYIWHPVAVAEILAEIQLDQESLIAAILHDVVEDTPYTKADITERFGESVSEIVDGVTKLGKLQFDTPQEAQAENFRKMILAMARDIRVILIKLADRLHNMRTLGVMRPDKQRRIAHETLDIFAPIAGRLGINAIRIELEDLGFKAMNPTRYAVLENAVKKARGNRNEVIEQITDTIQNRLDQENIPGKVLGREKHLYSLYKKMKNKRQRFADILDIFAFRILVDTADECYRTLGSLHSLYKPLPGRFKDYIAIPKSNGYQSLHTVLFGPYGVHLEAQIRSTIMHEVSEHGIAAHWQYKQNDPDKISPVSNVDLRAQEWVKSLLEIQQSAGNSLDFLENVKIDLFPDVIYVFTPKGDIITLPRGSTPVDFAYAVHTNIGHSTIGCRIDKKMVPLRTPLESGKTINIIKGPEAHPNPAWLNFIKTAKARSQIRHFMKHQQSGDAIQLGQRILSKSLRKFNMAYEGLTAEIREELMKVLNIDKWDLLLEDLGSGNRMAPLVAKQIHDAVLGSDDKIEVPKHLGQDAPLPISGTEGMVIHFANCCHPIPGDEIVGFISIEKGLVIHRCGCHNIKHSKNNPDKTLEVHWEEDVEGTFLADIQLEAVNKRGTLANIANEIAKNNTDIERVRSEDKDETYSLMQFTITVRNRVHLAQVLRRLKQLPIVDKVHRL